MRSDNEPVVVEETLGAPIETVWRAITEIDKMRQWYFKEIPEFRPEVGFETQFNIECGGRNFPHVWQVTEVVPPQRIAYDWSYEGYPGDSFVVFELSEQNDTTRIRLTHQARKDFPEDVPEFSRENCVGGWTYFIRESLKRFLEGNT